MKNKDLDNEDKKLELINYSQNLSSKRLRRKNLKRLNMNSINENNELGKEEENLTFTRFNKNYIYELNSNESLINNTIETEKINKINKKKKKIKDTDKLSTNFENNSYPQKNNEIPLILINANNKKYSPKNSNYILNNYDFYEAINYEQRKFLRIFFIYLIAKENLLNTIFFNPPLELKTLRICMLIFSYSCDFALNALFFLTNNISDIYHYNGVNKLLFSLINNLTISLISTLISLILISFFKSLTQSNNKIKSLFNQQDNLLKTDKNYSVTENKKIEIQKKIKNILKCLKIKIIFFIIFESLMMLFFFYYCTAFCSVYKSTQISWFLDGLTSYGISILISIGISFACSILYKISINCSKFI